MDNETRHDVEMMTVLGLVALLIIAEFVIIRIIIPGLVNMHNDGALIAAVLLALFALGGGYVGARLLFRIINIMKVDKN